MTSCPQSDVMRNFWVIHVGIRALLTNNSIAAFCLSVTGLLNYSRTAEVMLQTQLYTASLGEQSRAGK